MFITSQGESFQVFVEMDKIKKGIDLLSMGHMRVNSRQSQSTKPLTCFYFVLSAHAQSVTHDMTLET